MTRPSWLDLVLAVIGVGFFIPLLVRTVEILSRSLEPLR